MENTLVIFYATWHGQARKVAGRIADVALMRGVQSTIVNIADPVIAGFSLNAYRAAIVVGSVHFGRHPAALTRFVRKRVTTLSTLSTGFVSLSAAAAGLHGEEEAHRYIHRFLGDTGWQPDVTLSAAGAVPYTHYGFVTRKLMEFASRIAGRDSDSSRNYEYTNWFAVEDFTREFLAEAGIGTSARSAARS